MPNPKHAELIGLRQIPDKKSVLPVSQMRLEQTEDIRGERPFSRVFSISQWLSGPSGGDKGKTGGKEAEKGQFPGSAGTLHTAIC